MTFLYVKPIFHVYSVIMNIEKNKPAMVWQRIRVDSLNDDSTFRVQCQTKMIFIHIYNLYNGNVELCTWTFKMSHHTCVSVSCSVVRMSVGRSVVDLCGGGSLGFSSWSESESESRSLFINARSNISLLGRVGNRGINTNSACCVVNTVARQNVKLSKARGDMRTNPRLRWAELY